MKTRVAISAGHSHKAKGAHWEGFSEWPETRIWAELIMQALSKDFTVFLVPEDSLTAKVDLVNKFEADLAVEVHFNGGGTATTSGCETLHAPGSEKGIRLAKLVQERLVAALGVKDRGTKEGWHGAPTPTGEGPLEGKTALNYWLRATKCPAIIVEPEFVQQYKFIEAHRLAGAKAIAQAVTEYFAGEEVTFENDDEEPPVRAAESSRGGKSKRFVEPPED
jgi:N-acetylmuramoyl-L-alanine amidase